MDIQIKNIRYNPAKSRYSNYFRAELHINQQLVGKIWNDGNGGNTWNEANDKQHKVIVNEAELHFLKLPKVCYPASKNRAVFSLQPTLRNFIDDKVFDFLKTAADQEFREKVEIAMIDGVVYGDEYSFKVISLGAKVELLVSKGGDSSHIVQTIKHHVIAQLSDGIRILNTNIPVKLLLQAGLKEDDFLKL